MSYEAIFETGSKQFAVSVGDIVNIPRIDGAAGDSITFDRVLLAKKGDGVEAGRPNLEGANVSAEIMAQDRETKIVVFRFKRRTTYRRKTGHRQPRTTVRITGVNA
jgi:large subunit ribosomal protein L21